MSKSFTESDLDEFYKSIGKNVAKHRQEKDVSQLELAQAIGHKSTTIISLAEISKTKRFNLEHLYKIAKYLDVDICDLIEPNS